ncbi:hypothetical protein SLS53_005739 [Cytospora paraplurivora]|uniref:Uncharacterized protein n=1 Tax=Cytospora paraplurivora TaxID=2898453 RepID=A0AAN9YEW4_9PEZI
MPSTLSKTIISAVAFVSLVQICPAPFLAIPAAVAAGVGDAATIVGAAATVAGTVKKVKDATKKSSKRDIMRRHILPGDGIAYDESHPVAIAARAEQNELAWKLCGEQLHSASLNFSSPSDNDVLVKGIPSACMTLSTVLTGQYNTGNPVPEGTDSILFQNLNSTEIQEIHDALESRKSS